MHGKKTPAVLWLTVALLGLVATGCGKGYKQIVVIDSGAAEWVTLGRGPRKPQEEKIWVPGRTLVFRTDSTVPGAPTSAKGKAGHVYRLNDQLEMEEIGEFPLTMPNDTLAYQYGT
ncbi:MAG TPA: hypothetical protein VGG03_00855 [Thermoanaerobaculia bacterium]|jgi:hypothetical protein